MHTLIMIHELSGIVYIFCIKNSGISAGDNFNL